MDLETRLRGCRRGASRYRSPAPAAHLGTDRLARVWFFERRMVSGSARGAAPIVTLVISLRGVRFVS